MTRMLRSLSSKSLDDRLQYPREIILNGETKELFGKIKISGSKNATLPMLAASILYKNVILKNVPKVIDVIIMVKILEHLGRSIIWDDNNKILKIINEQFQKKSKKIYITTNMCSLIRASILFLGAGLARYNKVILGRPGGCQLGYRPINYHIDALKKMGVKFSFAREKIIAERETLQGTEIKLPYPSVGATENTILAAVGARGETIIKNIAIEPEIIDLINFLKKGGVQIEVNTKERIITVSDSSALEYVSNSKPIFHEVIPDRIESLTYISALGIRGGEIKIENVRTNHINAPLTVFKKIGYKFREVPNNTLIVGVDKEKLISDIEVETAPYPGFPTDCHPLLAPLFLTTKGTAILRENVYRERFKYIEELAKLNAKIKVDHSHSRIIINGPQQLIGGRVTAPDLRGGASLILAGIIAKNKTYINNVYQIYRGYERIEEKLRSLGVNVNVVQ